MSSIPTKAVLLIGASRGLGYGMAAEYLNLGWQVVATKRGSARTKLDVLAEAYNERLVVETVDINEVEEIAALRTRLAARTFDLLFVNAGITNDGRQTIADVTTEEFVHVMVTNALSPMRVIEMFQDLVPSTGMIGVMSSGFGSIANNDKPGFDLYRGSKAALNTFMRSFAARHRDDPRTLLTVSPGWVRTDMGGPNAALSIEQSVPTLIATMEAQLGKRGLQFLDYLGRTIPW